MRYFLLLLILIANVCHADNIKAKILSEIKKTDPNINIGIKIVNLDKNKIIFARNVNRLYTPASTLKFITAINAYRYLGNDFKFYNKLLYLDNKFYLKIHNPDFNDNDLEEIATKIKQYANQNNISKINIQIIKDNFALPPISPQKIYNDVNYCYGAPVTKMHINKNCSKVIVKTSQPGQNLLVEAPPNFPYIINNEAITVKKGQPDRLFVKINNGIYNITGTLSKNYSTVPISGVVDDEFQNIQQHLLHLLKENNLNFTINFIDELPKNKNAELIYEKNISLKALISEALKKSDNFITDYLFAEISDGSNQWRHAANSLKDRTNQYWDVDLTKTRINDGSGISHLNKLTPNHFSDLLRAVSKSSHFENIKKMMAGNSDSSALSKRFTGKKFKIHAKTGSLSGVSSMVGYFYNKKNELHSFVIMTNNFLGSNAKYRKLEENIISHVAK